jgi:hypothetical protein
MGWIPWNLVIAFVQLALEPDLPPNPTFDDIVRAQAEQFRLLPILGGLALVGIFFVFPITNGALIYAISASYQGRTVTPWNSIKFGVRKIWPQIWTMILIFIAAVFGVTFCVVPTILLMSWIGVPAEIAAGMGLLVGALVTILLMLWFGLTTEIVVLENLNGFEALARSRKLVRSTLVIFFIMGLMVLFITAGVVSQANFIPQELIKKSAGVVLSSITTIFSTAVSVVYYFSCRCTVENFDLEYLVASSASTPVTAEPTDEIPETQV